MSAPLPRSSRPRAIYWVVETWTLCDGWVNCWSVDDVPATFPSRAAATAELDAFLAEIAADIAAGCRDPEAGYDRGEFRIVAVRPATGAEAPR
jgi:hypothetical protein